MKIRSVQVEDAAFQMAPMIDMVFLLLVFFMCASHLSVIQNVPLEIPWAKKAKVPKERPGRFIVNITKDGAIHAGNVPLGDDMKKLKEMVKAEKAIVPDLKIYLRADKETKHRDVKKVMGIMAEMGIDDFIFGAFLPQEGAIQ
ncbi:MAG: biopolymer transporter ExbD [Verrucomicrobiota bacterium]|nr:biopolymer transporter ExbD [Verrucomicrobiota bacterium]